MAGALGGTIVLFGIGLGFPQQQWHGLYGGLWALLANLVLFVGVSLLTPGSRPSNDTVDAYRRVGW
jgi:Na+/proline symporter